MVTWMVWMGWSCYFRLFVFSARGVSDGWMAGKRMVIFLGRFGGDGCVGWRVLERHGFIGWTVCKHCKGMAFWDGQMEGDEEDGCLGERHGRGMVMFVCKGMVVLVVLWEFCPTGSHSLSNRCPSEIRLQFHCEEIIIHCQQSSSVLSPVLPSDVHALYILCINLLNSSSGFIQICLLPLKVCLL